MIKQFVCVALLGLLCGCAASIEDFNVQPHLSPVGDGLITQSSSGLKGPLEPLGMDESPLTWEGTSADLFRDPRARRAGDIVTVKISIDDKASFDNSNNRSRDSKVSAGFGVQLDFVPTKYPTSGEANVTSKSESDSQGTIERKEEIDLSVAAVVTGVLPNGNLIISGSQEVRVNYEVRVLSIAGIVRPQDISRENTIAYDKIAEARVSYGGRGRITEVQQPGWGQQLFDLFTPF